jgi:hypothetical protein
MRTKILALLALSLVAITANAATVIYSANGTPENPSKVTAIQGLDVGGVLYNVDFNTSLYDTFGGDDTFWTTQADAQTAANAINSLLNAEAVTGTVLSTAGGAIYEVNFGGAAGAGIVTSKAAAGDWGDSTFSTSGFHDKSTAWSTTVPVPGAVWLFGSALAGMGWMRRKARS